MTVVTGTEPEELALRYRAKDELRRRVRAIRRVLPEEARQKRSHAIVQRVLSLPAYKGAETVLGYVSMAGEADPHEALEHAHEAGKVVVLPRLGPDDTDLSLHRVEADTPLETSAFRFEQPTEGCPIVLPADVDLVLVPALVADERGHRIGWGKGYYDRLLEHMPKAVFVVTIYHFQLLAELPNTPGDIPVHFVATDERLITVADP